MGWRQFGGGARSEGKKGGHRQPYSEFGALVITSTGCAHRSTMRINQALDDRQPQPQPALIPPRAAILLPEALEDMRQKFAADSLAVVADDNFHHGMHALQLHGHSPCL